MKQSISLHPSNSIVFVCDPGLLRNSKPGTIPEVVRGALVSANETCINVVCMPEQDGPTKITLADISDVSTALAQIFDGEVITPDRRLALSTVENDAVLSMPVKGEKARVQIWANHPKWPDEIVIGVA
jgi:hypothetical protein